MKTDPGGADDMKYAFVNGKILDGSKDMEVREGLNILVENEKIVDIVPAEKGTEGYEKIELAGRYIMPGLINMHVHLAGNGKPQKKQRDNEKLVNTIMGSALTRAVAYKMVCGFARDELFSGVTTIRTVGGLAISIRDCGMRSLRERNAVPGSLPPTAEFRFRAGTWQARWRLPHTASTRHCATWSSRKRKRWT